jgi:hypothetical protein
MYEITKADIAAIRKANCVRFESDQDSSFMIAVKEKKNKSKNNKTIGETIHKIQCNKILRDYSNGYSDGSYNVEKWEGKHTEYPAEFRFSYTLFSFIKPGDVVTLKWIASNNSIAMSEKGFVRDELRVNIQRGKKIFPFMIDTRVTLNPGSFRMVNIKKLRENL